LLFEVWKGEDGIVRSVNTGELTEKEEEEPLKWPRE
jgi:hypothetical protein